MHGARPRLRVSGLPISGATRLAAVIGRPVAHSRSPAIHNAAFAAAGLDWRFLAFDVEPGAVESALAGVRALGIAGLSVTMPHKEAVAAALDDLSPAAAKLGAVNCVVNSGGRLVGHNTDGEGFLRGLLDDAGIGVAGRRCVVIGAGGAARAVVLACADAGAREVIVVNRSAQRAAGAAALAEAKGTVGTLADAARADLVVNASPAGMGDDRSMPVDPTTIRATAIVVDLVYHPAETAWLAACRARGIAGHNGASMLLHQAAVAFELWTGGLAPVAAMRSAMTV